MIDKVARSCESLENVIFQVGHVSFIDFSDHGGRESPQNRRVASIVSETEEQIFHFPFFISHLVIFGKMELVREISVVSTLIGYFSVINDQMENGKWKMENLLFSLSSYQPETSAVLHSSDRVWFRIRS